MDGPSRYHHTKNDQWHRRGITHLRRYLVSVQVLVAQSRPTLFDPMDCCLPGSSVHGILQARIQEWIATPFSRGSNPGLLHCRCILYCMSHQLQTNHQTNPWNARCSTKQMTSSLQKCSGHTWRGGGVGSGGSGTEAKPRMEETGSRSNCVLCGILDWGLDEKEDTGGQASENQINSARYSHGFNAPS